MVSTRSKRNLKNAACFELNPKEKAKPIKLFSLLCLYKVDCTDKLKIELKLKLSLILWLPHPCLV